jgi:hypothetical protein
MWNPSFHTYVKPSPLRSGVKLGKSIERCIWLRATSREFAGIEW